MVKLLDALTNLCIEDIMEMSDEEVIQEGIEEYGSEAAFNEAMERVRSRMLDTIEKHRDKESE